MKESIPIGTVCEDDGVSSLYDEGGVYAGLRVHPFNTDLDYNNQHYLPTSADVSS
ncbi:9243_t:CDS:2, partial [Gigaspora rosea]